MPKARNIENEERATRALNLRAQGFSYEQIADRLEYSGRGAVHNAVSNLIAKRQAEGVDELRAQGQVRYETIIREMSGILSERKRETVVNDDGVEVKMVPVYGPAERTAAARSIIRAQDSMNRLFGLNVEQPSVDARTQLLVVEAETLSNNMAAVLAPQQEQIELGEIVDVVVEDD